MSSAAKPTGYRLALSGDQTWLWANNPSRRWPGSYFAGKAVAVLVDANGIEGLQVWGHTPMGEYKPLPIQTAMGSRARELEALVADNMPLNCRHLWPAWEGRA